MNRKLGFYVLMAVLVAGLFLTASCAKKTVVSDATTIEDQAKTAADAAAEAEAARKAEQERIRQQELQEEAARKEGTVQARTRFLNQHIHFEFDSAQLTDTARALLREKADWLKANSGTGIVIEGHCDERGTTEYNLALGERRAAAAKQYLQDLGIGAYRMTTVSYGEERPLDPGQNEAAYSKNRRAQFVLK
ncbi:MAG: peptidoglycan-associated lipoprotein Pal [Desulfotignum sp.]|nr:peptidoglycan-associated lipoprotein Pal [Desulfotignum sp.]